jgi:hypothetical protein
VELDPVGMHERLLLRLGLTPLAYGVWAGLGHVPDPDNIYILYTKSEQKKFQKVWVHLVCPRKTIRVTSWRCSVLLALPCVVSHVSKPLGIHIVPQTSGRAGVTLLPKEVSDCERLCPLFDLLSA